MPKKIIPNDSYLINTHIHLKYFKLLKKSINILIKNPKLRIPQAVTFKTIIIFFVFLKKKPQFCTPTWSLNLK